MRNKKEVFKIWGIIVVLGISTSYVGAILQWHEGLLIMRIIAILFFSYILFRVKRFIDSYKELIKDGWAQHLFDPKYLYTTLWLGIIGIIAVSIMEYLYLPTDWFLVYICGISIIPFSSGIIPIRKRDNKWRK